MIKIKYTELMNFQFSQAMQKIASAPVHGNVASQIHKVARQIDWARKRIMKEYQDEIVETFGKRDKDGKLIRPENEPNGFEPEETKVSELEAAQKDFDAREIELKCSPFTIQLFGDIKISAQDLQALKGLYTGNDDGTDEKPEMPKDNVASLR